MHRTQPLIAPVPRARSGVGRLRRGILLVWLAALEAIASVSSGRRRFDVPVGDAEATLPVFISQADVELVYSIEKIDGVRTHAIRGEFSVREALERMVRNTDLVVVEDRKTGALSVNRVRPTPASRVSATPSHSTEASTTTLPMKRKNPIALVASWLALAFTPVAEPAAATPPPTTQALGVISGRVSNDATGAFLEGALVQVSGSATSTTTARDGSFSFSTPAGTHELTASYTGLKPQQASVTVNAGQTASRDFALSADIYRLDAFVVAGEREGNALAATLQRNAPNVKNVISADAFGSLAGNPADLLEKVPGVTVDRVGGDIRTLLVRGIDDTLNSVQVDGNRIASVTTDRGFSFQNVNSDHIESMEVVKALTPDSDADAIGGTINLKSRSAFNLKGRRVSYSVGGIIASKRDRLHPAFTFSYSDVWNVAGGSHNLGISLTVGFREHRAVIDNSRQDYQNTPNRPAFLYRLDYSDFANTRTRYGGGVKIDYKLSDRSSVFVNLTASPHRENSFVRRHVAQSNQVIATIGANGQPTGTGAIMPGFTDEITVVRGGLTTTSSINAALHLHRLATAYTAQAGGQTAWNGWVADYDASYSFANNKQFQYTSTSTLNGAGWIFDKTGQPPHHPQLTYTSGPDTFNLDNYTTTTLALVDTPKKNDILGAQLNVQKRLAVPLLTSLKAGLKGRQESIELTNRNTNWAYTGGRLSQFTDAAYSYAPFDGFYPHRPQVSVDALVAAKDAGAPGFVEDVATSTRLRLTGAQVLTETVSAGYILGNAKLGALSLLAGARVEDTRVEATGSVQHLTAEERARRTAFQGTITPEEARRRVIAEYGTRRTVKSGYTDVFPSVHLKYNLSRGLLLRASYSTGIGRPAPTQIIPLDNIDDVNQIVRVNNVGLLPQYSKNYDLSAEYYFEPAGIISVGVFSKDIRDFIHSTSGETVGTGANNGFEGNYAGYELRSQANGGAARVRGYEINYQQQFSFLTGWLAGFGAFANFTHLEAKGDYGNPGSVIEHTDLTGFVPRAVNAGLSYIRGKISVRMQYAYNGEKLVAFNAAQPLRRYILPSNRVDVKLKYYFDQRLGLYFDAYNIAGDNLEERWGVHDRYRFLQDRHDPQFHFGVEGRF